MQAFIRMLAVLYGLNGLLFLGSAITLVTVTDVAFFSELFSENEELRNLSDQLGEGFIETMWYGIIAFSHFEALSGLILLYALWTLKAWGRYFALIYSALWFIGAAAYLYALLLAPTNTDVLTLFGVLLRVATVVVCLRRDGKELLSN